MHNPLEITHITQVKLSSKLHDQDVKEITQEQILFSSVGDLCQSATISSEYLALSVIWVI